jgi:branched-chain amino acid transport system permease protein
LNVYIIPGLVIGCVYAIVGVGLVLTYSTSGVLNLAYGAIGFTVANLFYWLRVHEGFNGWVSLAICVLVFCPLAGIVLWRYLFRFLVGTGLIPPLIASIGLAVALPALCEWVFKPGQILLAPGIPNHGSQLHKFGSIALSADQMFAVGGAILITVSLFWLLRFTSLGLQMRAVFDNRPIAALTGTSPGAVSTFSWALAVSMAGFGGILLAPVLQLDPNIFLTMTVASLAAALVAGLRSIAITLLAALGLGILSSVIAGLDTGGGLIAQAIQPSLPFIVMAIVLFARRTPLESGELPRVLKGVRIGSRSLPRALERAAPVVALFVLLPFILNDFWTGVVGEGFIYALIFLSFTVALGDGGMIPLGQAALVGIGGFFAGMLGLNGVPLLLAIVIGVLFTGGVGLVVGYVGGRLGPLEFGFLTLAFGLFADNFIYNWHSFVSLTGTDFGVPGLFSLHLATAFDQYFLFGIALGLGLLGVWLFRRLTVDFYVNAVRLNSRMSESLGVNSRYMRVYAFTFASMLAGFGGGMLGVFQKHLGPEDVTTATGLVWLAVIVTMGVRRPGAAVIGGMLYAVMPAILAKYLPLGWGYLPTVLFGLGGLALAQDPRGIISLHQDQFKAIYTHLRGRRLRPAT